MCPGYETARGRAAVVALYKLDLFVVPLRLILLHGTDSPRSLNAFSRWGDWVVILMDGENGTP